MKKKILWLVFACYVGLSGYTISHHELWGDEVHSWNICKGSGPYTVLLANSRYEGHPPAWYTILWTITRFTHKTDYMQVAQWTIACAVVFLILFYSPFPTVTKILLSFGYYFLYEYAVLSRNYAIGVLLACCICLIIRKEFRYQPILYYLLLFCLSNTHLLALLLAGSLHLYYLLWKWEQKRTTRVILFHTLTGTLIFLPALYFIFPPSDSQLNMQYWQANWNFHHIKELVQAPLRAFLPMPAWWNYNSWNTEFLLEAKIHHPFIKFINPLIAFSLLALVFFIFRKNKKCLALFTGNTILSFIIALVFFPLTTARYAGYIYISFVVTAWLYSDETPLAGNNRRLIHMLLILQLIAGLFAVVKDIRLPFSNLPTVNELIKEVPANERWVTDYWTMNTIVAVTDRPVYCIDLEKEISFILWKRQLTVRQTTPDRYTSGLHHLFQKDEMSSVYMITQNAPDLLSEIDPQLSVSFHVALIDKREGAIDRGSNLYLYRITKN